MLLWRRNNVNKKTKYGYLCAGLKSIFLFPIAKNNGIVSPMIRTTGVVMIPPNRIVPTKKVNKVKIHNVFFDVV